MSPLDWGQKFCSSNWFGVPMSPATSASRPEKIILQSTKFSGLHSCTTSSLTTPGIGVDCFQVTAREYGFPADLDEAPSTWILNHGWAASRTMNRWPTVPVAPSTPTLILQSDADTTPDP